MNSSLPIRPTGADAVGAGAAQKRARYTARTIATLALQFVLAALLFRLAGYYRPFMDADEGHFLSAIRCVYDGLAPCRDFFFQQTPLFPYPYAAAMKVFGYGYESCLWVSIFFGAGLATVTAAYFSDRSGSRGIGWIGWLLIVANANILFWMPTVKNHAMPLFFGALAIWAASRRPATARTAFAWSALAGFAALACVGSRLPAAPLAIVAAVWLFIRARSAPAMLKPAAAGFIAGAAAPLLLAARSILPDPWVAYFDIFGFHAMRSGPESFVNAFMLKLQLELLFHQIHFPLIAAIALAVLMWGVLKRRPTAGLQPIRPTGVEIGLAIAGFLAAAAALAPRQTFTQYFMVPLVLMIFASVPFWQRMVRAASRGPRVLAGILLVLYAGTFFISSEQWFSNLWGLRPVREMSYALRSATAPDDVVFSTWQGFTFLADRRDTPGNENFNARAISAILPPLQLRRLHIAPDAELAENLHAGIPKAIIIGFFASPYYVDLLCMANGRGGYFIDQMTHWYVLRPEIQRHYHLVKQLNVDSPNRQDHITYTHQLWIHN